MRRKKPLRRFSIWAGGLFCGITICLMLLNLRWDVYYQWDFYISVAIRNAAVCYYHESPLLHHPSPDLGFHLIGSNSTEPHWLPRCQRAVWPSPPGNRYIKSTTIPLWIPLVSVGLPTIFIWYLDHRSIPPGHCRHCGYDLSGNVSGICPECGTASPEEVKT